MASNSNSQDQTHSLHEATNVSDANAIKSRAGTVRGIHEGVKKRRSIFSSIDEKSNFSPQILKIVGEEKPNEETGFPGKIVHYTTSLHTIRERFDKCNAVSNILRNRKIKHEEKDVYLNPDFFTELKERTQNENVSPSQIFFKGEYLGDYETIFYLNESGEILNIFQGFIMSSIGLCQTCGDKRFILCHWCQGSKKGTKNKFSNLKCTICNVNGLLECPTCKITDK